MYTTVARTGIFRFVRGTINVNGTTVSRNSPALVDSNGNLKSGVPVCNGTTVIGNCVDSYNIFANDPQGIGADPATIGLVNKMPLPNNFRLGDGLNTAGFSWNPPSKFTGPNYMARVDHTFGPHDNLFVRWLQNTYNTKEGDFLNARPAVYPGFPPLGEVNRLGKNLAISYRHTFSPILVNEFTAGFNRFAFVFTFGESNPDFPNPQKVPIWADDCVLGSFANVDPPYCLSPHTARAITTPQFIDNLTWVHGAHTIRAGFNFRFYIHNDSRGFFGSNVVEPIIRFVRSDRSGAGFSNIPGAIAGNPATTPNSTDINHLRQAILELAGIPSRIQQAFLANFNANSYGSTNFATVYSRAHQYDSYIQDEWKLRPNLTLNLGLRWEYNPAPYDAKQTLVPNVLPDGSQGTVTFVKADGWFKNNNIGAVGPRVGVAWSPDKKTSVRAGYSWLFDTLSTFQVTAIAGKVPGFLLNCITTINNSSVATTSSGCVAPAGTANRISTGFPTSVPNPSVTPSVALLQVAQPSSLAASVGAFDPNIKNPSVHEWDLTIQRELPKHFVAEIGYIGKRGTHLYRAYDLNQVPVSQAGFLGSYNIARGNVLEGCNPDGTGCPTGVTGQTPTLLLQLASASNLNGRVSDFQFNSVGSLATFIDGRTGSDAITARGFPANYFRPNPQFGQIFYFDSGGDSYYHGLIFQLRKDAELRSGITSALGLFGVALLLGLFLAKAGNITENRWAFWSHIGSAGLGLVALIPYVRRRARQSGGGWRQFKKAYQFALILLVLLATRHAWPSLHNVADNPFTGLLRSPKEAAMFVCVAVLGGGLREEIQRAFILTRFERDLGGPIVGLVFSSIAFGAGHAALQGWDAAVATGLLGAVWGGDYTEQHEYLRVFIGQLRKKIESDPSKPRYILTEPWIGYRFNAE